MTDWLDWLLGELEEEENQGEDLDLSPHALPRRQVEENLERENAGKGPVPARYGGDTGPDSSSGDLQEGADVVTEGRGTERKDEKSRAEENEESESLSLPLAVKLERTRTLSQAARSMGTEPERSWQEGTPAGTGDVRMAEPGPRENWLPAGGTQQLMEDMDGTAAPRGSSVLYTAVRRARAAAEQVQSLRSTEPVVLREPIPVGGQSPTPAELDRIFQRDARRYDGGFTLF